MKMLLPLRIIIPAPVAMVKGTCLFGDCMDLLCDLSKHDIVHVHIDSVFGCELHKLCEREGTNVPKFLVKFMEHIEQNGLEVVGIYRLSGNAASVTKLRYLVEQGKM